MTSFTGKHLLFKILNRQKTTSIPWVPLVGVHAGKLTGYTAQEVLIDEEKLIESLLAVNKLYSPDGLPVYFDTQVEAEILGCDLVWTNDSTPSVVSHPLSRKIIIPEIFPTPKDGRLPIILNVMRKIKRNIGTDTALFGLITGPLTLAYHLRGQQLFLDILEKPDTLHKLIAYTTHFDLEMIKLYTAAGMDVIGIIEPITSQISPDSFNSFLAQPYRALFKAIHKNGAASMLHVCGKAEKIIASLCRTNPKILSLDENVSLPEIQTLADHYGVTLQGNIPVTTHLLQGTPADIKDYVNDLLKALPTPKHLILSPGCDLPWATPIENLLAAEKAVRDYQFN